METFVEPHEFVKSTGYVRDRGHVISAFAPQSIDASILDVVLGFAKLPQCFTLQSCCGHFIWAGQLDPDNLTVLPAQDIGSVRYRIAYVALCIENSTMGARLREALEGIQAIDTAYVQFGSPDWFWEQYPNSYALQVEPERFMAKDEVVIAHREALHVQRVRDEFFKRLRDLVCAAQKETGAG